MRFKSMVWLLCLSCLLLPLWGCNSSQAEGEDQEQVPVVNVSEAVLRDIQEVVTLTGQVTPRVDVKVMPEVGGKVEKIEVKVGEKVEKGQLLVQLANHDQRLQLQQAQASLKMAEARLAEVLAGAREQDLEQLRQALTAAELSYEQAVREYERMKELYDEGFISEQQYEGVRLQKDLAHTQLVSTQSRLSMAEEGAAKETVRTLEAQVEQAAAAVELAESVYRKTMIVAPVAGTVAMVNLNEGDLASPGMPAVVLVDIDTVHIMGALPEGAINRIEEGLKVEVFVPAVSSGPFEGVVEEISPVAPEGGRSYPVKVVINNPDGVLKSGMYARMEFPVEKRNQVLSVPLEALVTENTNTLVFIVEDGTAVKKELELGIRDEEYVEVLSGLNAGDRIIIRGQSGLMEGMEVEVLEEDL